MQWVLPNTVLRIQFGNGTPLTCAFGGYWVYAVMGFIIELSLPLVSNVGLLGDL